MAAFAMWRGLAPREKRMIAFGVAVLLAVLVYAFLWEPAAVGIKKLRADLPTMRAQNASMRTMGEEAQRLRAAGGNATVIAPAERVAAVRRSLERAGLSGGASPAAATADGSNPAGAVVTLTSNGPVSSGAAPAARASRRVPPEVVDEGNGRVRVRFDDIDYGTWVAWLASSEIELGARASRVSVSSPGPNGPVGRVRADAVFDWSAAPARS